MGVCGIEPSFSIVGAHAIIFDIVFFLKADGEDRPEQQNTTTPEPTATKRAMGASCGRGAGQPWPQRRPWLLL